MILTELFERAWRHIFTHYDLFTITTYISALVHLVVFLFLCSFPLAFQFMPFMDKYRIQKTRKTSFAGQLDAFFWVLVSQLVIQFPLIFGNYHFVTFMNIPCDYESIPAWYSCAWRLFACMFCEDTFHYFAHRLMHHKSLYKHVHKVHHKYQAPFGIAAEFAHPLETVVLGIGFFIGVFLFCSHFVLMWAWLSLRLLLTIDAHSGYDTPLPLNILKLLPGYGGARHHDWHHETFQENYSSTFVWWDNLFGTNKEYHKFYHAQQQQQNEKISANKSYKTGANKTGANKLKTKAM